MTAGAEGFLTSGPIILTGAVQGLWAVAGSAGSAHSLSPKGQYSACELSSSTAAMSYQADMPGELRTEQSNCQATQEQQQSCQVAIGNRKATACREECPFHHRDQQQHTRQQQLEKTHPLMCSKIRMKAA